MSKKYEKSEEQQIKEEFLKLKNENKKLLKKLDKYKSANDELKKELKKNDTWKINVSGKQEQLLSNKSKDMDIQSLLSD